MLWLCVLLFFMFFAGVAMTIGEGIWTNTINLMAVVLSSFAAIAFGFPLGVWAIEKFEKPPEFLWYFLFAGVWLVFFVFIMVFRIAAERLSRVRMRFVPPLEKAVGPLVGLAVAVMFTSFFAWTLLNLPIRAGEWKISEASSWQRSTFQYFSTPFNTVGKALFDNEHVVSGAVQD